ncbi:hypothetical protein [Herbidospora yilanensis]|uniref:hypothetical protein n=1 Tax=Herbidospora yilanensis TaxID=354426 RepID=UPI000A9442B0|nr:hypothetical protein [Herbidospora yilanensis]
MSVAARPSLYAATDWALDGETGLVIGPEAGPVAAYPPSLDTRTITAILALRKP